MANFDDDDSNHSVNGWIKKEIEDDDYEEFMKQEPQHMDEYPSSERYEELMSLSKEDLVGRILQQEEDIRYLQDIRHGMEKNVEGFSASCISFKKLLEVMASTMTTFRDTQQHVSSPGGTSNASSIPSRSTGIATTLSSSRPTASAPTSQASPRSTPSSAPAANTRSATSNAAMSSTPRSSTSTVTVPSNHTTASNAGLGDRMHTASSMSSHQTVTITKQTNVIIKTEIPSPPPSEPMITSSPLMSSNVPPANMSQPSSKNRVEPSPFYTKQQMPSNQGAAAKSFTSSRSITDIANSILPNRQRARMNSTQSFGGNNSKACNQPNRTNMPQQFQAQPQPSTPHFISGRGGRGRANHPQRSAPYATQRPMRQAPGVSNPSLKPRVSTAPTSTSVQQPGPGDSSMNDILANISFKVPSGITLSIVPPKSGSDPRTQPSHADKAAAVSSAMKQAAAEASGRANVSHPLHSGNTPLVEEISASKPSMDKGVSNAGVTNTSYSTASAMPSMSGKFQVEEGEEEDEDYFDEIAVLIPDKKPSPGLEGSSQQNVSDNMSCNAIVSVESHAKSQSNELFWNSHKSNPNMFQSNAEYMFEEPDDFDSDENDAKVYLGENVSLPRELVDSCIKQGPTPTKLTRNLMKALFPDLRELAAGCPEGDGSRPSQPSLPPNKVKAIIALVQKTFPQVNRAAIVMAMNMRCKEAKTMMAKANPQAYSSY